MHVQSILPPRVDDFSVQRAFEDYTRTVEEKFHFVHRELRMLMAGIDLRDHRRFRATVPHVHRSLSGRTVTVQTRGDSFYDRKRAEFCLKFLIDVALLAEETSRGS